MKTALITGVTGQDGSYLVEFLLNKGYKVHGIKRRSSSFNTERIDHLYQDPHESNPQLILHYGDLTDSTNLIRILQSVQPDEIYNLGAQSHVAVSFETPEYTANCDALGILKPTPLYTALEAVRFNLNRKQESLRLFEFSKTYDRKNDQLTETNNLCLFRIGNKQESSWMEQTAPVTFHHLFGDIEDLIQKSGNDSPILIPTISSIFE